MGEPEDDYYGCTRYLNRQSYTSTVYSTVYGSEKWYSEKVHSIAISQYRHARLISRQNSRSQPAARSVNGSLDEARRGQTTRSELNSMLRISHMHAQILHDSTLVPFPAVCTSIDYAEVARDVAPRWLARNGSKGMRRRQHNCTGRTETAPGRQLVLYRFGALERTPLATVKLKHCREMLAE